MLSRKRTTSLDKLPSESYKISDSTQTAVTMCQFCWAENQQEFWKCCRFNFIIISMLLLLFVIVVLVAVAVFLLLTGKPTRSLKKRNGRFEFYYYFYHITVIIVTRVAVVVCLSCWAENQQKMKKICSLWHIRVLTNTMDVTVVFVLLRRKSTKSDNLIHLFLSLLSWYFKHDSYSGCSSCLFSLLSRKSTGSLKKKDLFIS